VWVSSEREKKRSKGRAPRSVFFNKLGEKTQVGRSTGGKGGVETGRGGEHGKLQSAKMGGEGEKTKASDKRG